MAEPYAPFRATNAKTVLSLDSHHHPSMVLEYMELPGLVIPIRSLMYTIDYAVFPELIIQYEKVQAIFGSVHLVYLLNLGMSLCITRH